MGLVPVEDDRDELEKRLSYAKLAFDSTTRFVEHFTPKDSASLNNLLLLDQGGRHHRGGGGIASPLSERSVEHLPRAKRSVATGLRLAINGCEYKC